MVIRHPLVVDHYKSITLQTSKQTFFYLLCTSNVRPKEIPESINFKYWDSFLVYDPHASSYKTAKSMCASFTQFNALILFISLNSRHPKPSCMSGIVSCRP